MTRTEELGMRVNLTGNREAAQGIRETAGSTTQLADATKKQADAAKQAAGASSAAAQSIKQQGDAAAEAARKTREAADAQQSWAQRMASGAGGALNSVLSLARGAGVMAVAFAAFSAGAYFTKATDDAKLLLARIDGVTQSMSAARAEYRALYDDSQRLRTPLNETLQGYTRIAGAVKELGGTAKQARELNEIILATAKISGVSGQEAAAAARQFAQALGSGVLQGDELRSILENNQELARQLAKGLNVNVGELRKLGEEGKLTADVVANALLGRLPEIRTKLADVPLTTADAWMKLKTAMEQWLVAGDQVEMKAGFIAGAMNGMANELEAARRNAEKPIIVTISRRVVTETEGGVGLVAQSSGGGRITAQTQSILRTEQEMSRLQSIGTLSEENFMGLRDGAKRLNDEIDKYLDSVSLQSVKLQKKYDKEAKDVAVTRDKLVKALAVTGIPAETAKQLQEQLDTLNGRWAKATVETERKIAEAKKSEANKGMADGKRLRDAEYNELIAHQQRLIQAVDREVKSMAAVEKEKYDTGLIDAEQYHDAILRVEQLGYAERRGIIRTQLDATNKLIAAGDKTKLDDAQRLLGQLEAIDDKEAESVRKNVEAQRAIVRKWIDERFDALRAYDAAMTQLTQGTAEIIAEMNAANDERAFEISLLGQTEQAQRRMTEARKAELFVIRETRIANEQLAKAMTNARNDEERAFAQGAYDARLQAIQASAAATRDGNIAIGEQRAALQQAQGFWEGFFRSIEGGWKGIKNYLKTQFFDWLYKELARQVSLNVSVNAGGGGGGIMGFIGSLFGGGGGGGAGAGGMGGLGGLGSLFGGGGGILSSIIGSAPFIAGAGPLAAGSGIVGGLAGMGFTGAATMVAQFAQFIPVIGPLIAIASMFSGAFKNKDGVWFDIGDRYAGRAKDQRNVVDTALGKITKVGEPDPSTVAPFFDMMKKMSQSFVDVFGKDLADKARLAIGEWTGYSQRGRGTEYTDGESMKRALETESKDVMAEFFSRAFSVVDERFASAISGWKGSVEDLAKYITGLLNAQAALTANADLIQREVGEALSLRALDDLKKEGEDLATTLTRVMTTFAVTNEVAKLLGQGADAFGEVGIKSLEARERLIELAGGIDKLGADIKTYYEQFFTEEERATRARADAQKAVTDTFAGLNIAVPKTREEFRKIVEGLDLSTEAGQKAFVALMRLAPAFAFLTEEVESATTAVMDATDAYLENFFTAEERANKQRADANAQLSAMWNETGLSAARTREEYRRLIESQDLTTEAGRRNYNALMNNAGAFALVTDAADQSARALADVGANIGNLIREVREVAQQHIDDALSLIQSGTSGATERLLEQERYLRDSLARMPLNSAERAPYEQALQQVLNLQDVLVRAGAAAPGLADAMFEVQLEYERRLSLAQGNAQLITLIEAEYQRQRAEIIANGTQQGLNTLRDQLRTWLNGLLLNTQLTTLTPEARLAEARRQYEAAINSGDASAITGAADAYLREARDFYASGSAYAAIFAAVTAQISARAGGLSATLPIANPTIAPSVPSSGTAPSVTAANAAAASAAQSASASNAALAQALAVIADLTGRVKNAIDEQGETTRANDNDNTQTLVDAIEGRGLERVFG